MSNPKGLTPKRLARARELWESALELPLGDRTEYVRSNAGEDVPLGDFVMQLLAAHDATGDIFSRPLLEQAGFPAVVPSLSLVGHTLGPWRVAREIGHGGMGTVYEAVRADDQFTKRVAIKTLRRGTASTDMAKRFGRERQIHAALTHPNIAALIDAGITDDGIPYIVLEYVDGMPIDDYCVEKRLSLRARLDLFQQVIRAVDHAHRQLVVHRDLKPNNILVTTDGTVKLLDFGISKLISDAADHGTTEGQRAFTTAYASPEQIRGEPISTATDVYSLGVVLYGLLAGRQPFEIRNSTPAQAWETIIGETPPAPSTVATPEAAATMDFGTVARLSRALKGELDAIVLMALRKEPERRYRSAEGMGEDLQRYLRGLPVQARPDSAAYRARKLIARNRLAAAATAFAVIALLVGTGVSLSQARIARAERAVADVERRTAERVSGFLQDIFSSPNPTYGGRGLGPGATISDAVDAAAKRIDTELADEPRVALALHRVMSNTYTALRQTDKSAIHARRQVELLTQLGETGPALFRGLHDLGSMLRNSGRPDSALVVLEGAYKLIVERNFLVNSEVQTTLNELALSYWAAGRPREAVPHFRKSLEMAEQLPYPDVNMAIVSSNLGNALFAVGDLAGAEQAYRRTEELLRRDNRMETVERGAVLNNLTTVLILTGDYEEAERAIKEGIGVLTKVIGPTNERVAISTVHLARIEMATGRAAQALETIRRAAGMLSHLPPRHPERAREENYEAAILHALGRDAEAEPLARRALATRMAVGAPTDWRIAETEAILARILLARGKRDEALGLLQKSRQTLAATMGEQHPLTREVELDLSRSGGG